MVSYPTAETWCWQKNNEIMILEKMEPLAGKLDIFKDVLMTGKGMIVEASTWRVTVSFCSILKRAIGTFSRKVGNWRWGVGGSGSQDQNFANEMETRDTKIMSQFTSS